MARVATDLRVVPANEASWEDLQAVFGTRGEAARCQCQRFKIRARQWDSEEASRSPGARSSRVRHTCVCSASRSSGRADRRKDDSGVWAVPCFVTRAGFRRRGVSHALARAAVDFARGRGARALEGYPMLTKPGEDITRGELHVGKRSIFRPPDSPRSAIRPRDGS